ncbi:hypothetical protein [Defluviitalea phaphyphila]|uniref:hypothetical protein n=1 Tax=Defluviitalea phaphyphila TaxID=1473580 RepID=UPI00072FF375|nr:hypothetical protein [Defluviitalea phaphyphila]
MANKDEKEIVDLINKVEESIAQMIIEEEDAIPDIKVEDINIDGEIIKFSEVEVIPEKLKMYIPDEFKLIPEEIKKLKYPNENRPEYIYANKTYDINLTFKPYEENVEEEDLVEIRDSFKNAVKIMNPTSEFLGEGVIEAEFLDIPYFEIKTSAFDGDIYNLMFFLSVKEKFTMGTFNCLISDKEDWHKIAKAMIKTIV